MDHKCIEHLKFRESETVETHGLDCGPYEHWHQEWYECRICKERYTPKEADELSLEQDADHAHHGLQSE